MTRAVKVGNKMVGEGYPIFIIAEIGLNHNGNIKIAKKLIDVAVLAGCDAVKFQKRTPEICVPEHQKNIPRETPWGVMTYLEYRYKVEFERPQYEEIDAYCKEKGILWTASCWDLPSVDFVSGFNPAFYKIASAMVTDERIISNINSKGKPVILSTGMSTMEQIRHAASLIDEDNLLIAHCTSTYPCKPEELNLRMIHTLQKDFGCPVGYSGHEVGLQTTLVTIVLGASFVERHITLDRAMWGSDHAASVEPWGFMRLVRDLRVIEKALGDGVKKVYDSEQAILKKLRASAAPTPEK